MSEDSYLFSFTALALRLNDTIGFYRKWQGDQGQSLPEISSGRVKAATHSRQQLEYLRRLSSLTPNQQSLLLSQDYDTARQIAFLAIGKSYGFIRDFILEVLRDKVLVFDYQLAADDIQAFVRRKSLSHPELEGLSSTTITKANQVMLKMLAEAGLIDSVKSLRILPQLVNHEVVAAIAADNPEWLKIFLYTDHEIHNLIKTL